MRRRKDFAVAVSLAALLLLVPGSFPGGGAAEDARTAGWEEGSPGRWNSLPQRKAEADKDFFRAEAALAPGTGVLWEKKVNSTLRSGETLSIEMVSTGTNRTSRDYRRYDAHFPISVTVVFGQDFESLTWKKRVADFFRAAWNGFSPSGIRLTFAYGSVVPVGSMYRLGEEETVFILAGEEEQGKRIDIVRDLRDDFRAAYGREPKGPVTRILVSAERPSRESGPLQTEIRITSPLLR